jgi:hypothetical protein
VIANGLSYLNKKPDAERYELIELIQEQQQ